VSNKEAIRKLLSLLAQYKKILSTIIICLIFSTGLNLCIPLLSKDIMDKGFIAGDKKLLIELVLISAFLYAMNSAVEVFKEYKRIDVSSKLEYSLSKQAVTHLMKVKMSYFNKTNYAEIMNIISVDIGNILSITDNNMFLIITQIFNITGGIIGLLIINYKLTILVVLFIPLKYFIMKFFAKKRKQIMDEFITANQDYAKWFGDTVGGIQEVKLFGILPYKIDEFKAKQERTIHEKKKLNMLGEFNNALDTVILEFLSMILYIVGANMVFSLQLSIGSIFAFITYSSYVTGPISAILNIGYLLSGIIPSTKRFYEFMDLQEEYANCEKKEHPMFGDLEMKNVSFSYDGEKSILKDVTINFPKESKVALIGSNGSGKSTIIGLLTGLYDSNHGEVLLNGENVKDFCLSEYRELFSIVSQQIYLFNDTIKNNICLYKPVSDSVMKQAIKDSGLEEFIDAVSLNYKVGQNGSMLSGGQKQKIAMARALVHNRPILIFDEATSNSDINSELQINHLLLTRLKNKTVIVVTHKSDILHDMDNIIFLNEGQLFQGNYENLYSGNNAFNEMIKLKM
jgi:ATP-binding cassette subfamily B protein/subfamily B ATP-binding cassette protein MsbA